MKKALSLILAVLMLSACFMFSASAAETFYGPDFMEKYGLQDGVVELKRGQDVEYIPTPEQAKSGPTTGGTAAHDEGTIKYSFNYDETYIYATVSVLLRGADTWWGDNMVSVHFKPAKAYTGDTWAAAHSAWYGTNEGWASMGGSGNADRWLRFEAKYVAGQGFTEGGAGYNSNGNTYAKLGATFESNGAHVAGEWASFTVKMNREYITKSLFGGNDDLGYAFYVRSGYSHVVYGGSWMNDEGQALVGSAAGWNHWDWMPLYLVFDNNNDDVMTSEKASVRISAIHNGLRFKTNVRPDFIAALQAVEGNTVEVGTLIAPTDTLGGAKLTHEFAGKKLDVPAKIDAPFAEGHLYNTYAGSITNINEKNLDREFTAVGYVKVTNGETVKYYYSDAAASRSAAYVATLALEDAESYTATQLELIQALIPAKVEA